MDIENTDLREPDDKVAFAQFIRSSIQPHISSIITLSKGWFNDNKDHLLTLFYPNTYTEEAFRDWSRKRFYYWMFNTQSREINKEIEELLK